MSAWWWLVPAYLAFVAALLAVYHAARQHDRKAGR